MEPITNEEMKAALVDAGVPEKVISAVEGTIEDKDLKTEYTLASKLLLEQKAVIVYGSDAPLKETICAKLMRKYMFKNRKTGRWLTPAQVPTSFEDLPGAGIVTIVGVDLLMPAQARVVAQAVRDWLPRGRAFVLSVSSEAALLSAFGVDLKNYLSHSAAVVNVNVPPAKQFT